METLRSSNGQSKTRSATLADVAQEVGVSTMTVSNVLNGRYKTSSHREAILEAVQRLNFQLDPHAQRLASGFSRRTVAILSVCLDLGVATLKLHTIQQLLTRKGYDVPLHIHDFTPLHELEKRSELVRDICRQRPRAIVIYSEALAAEFFDDLKNYQDSGGILISYDHPVPIACDQVIFDREENTYLATRSLLERGHREIGFANHGFEINQERFRGYKRAFAEFGLTVRDEWVFHGHFNYEEWGANLAQIFVDLQHRPTGVVIVNDATASAFVQSLMRQGWQIPRDVSVVGHDDIAPGRYCIVPLTTVSHPVEDIAEAVCQLLTNRLNHTSEEDFQTITVRGRLVERESLRSITKSHQPPAHNTTQHNLPVT